MKFFYRFTKSLKIELSDTDNHQLPSTKIKPILKDLEEQGMPREFVFENYCKLDIVEKYNKNFWGSQKKWTNKG